MDIALRINHTDKELIEGICTEVTLEPELIKSAGMDGGNDLVTILISITTTSLTALIAILKSKWNRNKNVSIEVDGMKVKGADPEQIESLLAQMLAAKTQKKVGK